MIPIDNHLDWKVLQQIAFDKLAKEFREEHDKEKLTWWYAQTERIEKDLRAEFNLEKEIQ